ncbi:MAG: hypothetical protein LBF56_02460 [Holosporales bacterium]|jgi:chemotaxis protein histidine kinase CheA|nr:hypothetical protein [Holosporales bacterium]
MCRIFRVLSGSFVVIGIASGCASALNFSGLLGNVKSAASNAAQSVMNNDQVKTAAASAAEKAKTAVENKASSVSASQKKATQAEKAPEKTKDTAKAETSKAEVSTKSTDEKTSNSNSLFSSVLGKATEVAKTAASSTAADQIKAAALGAINNSTAANSNAAAPSAESAAQQQAAAAQREKNQQIMAVVDPIFAESDKIGKSQYIGAVGMNLTDEHMQYFVKKLVELSNAGVEKLTLNLSDNMFTAAGLSLLLDTLGKHVKLASILVFSRNKIGDDGAFLLAGALHKMPVLKYIILSDTGITGVGVYAIISTVVDKDCQVEMLDFSNNAISNEQLSPLFERLNAVKPSVLEDGIYLNNNMLNLSMINTVIPVSVRDLKIQNITA